MATLEWLGNLLSRIETYPERAHALYLEGIAPFEVKTRAVILERDVYSGELPEFAKAHGLRKSLSVAVVRGIVENARQQRPDVSPSNLVRAFNHYWKRDAFIDFDALPEDP
ncbi:hypothetical protein JY651_28795 [Pyxidicoccus parkwayensis]|uniref:DUF7716 domain-containing protein n=1 Tax=Pyxidicoccus parkwayensis TaxID=2813578 RepID=A0ABX7NKH7_9BACT|nr:hypothetical protein [Pyxidicoccus parkwaysis]QSQ19331.1 hypothetical protein JY651_28795 [Pyxidicoccus parkwaysis]